MAPLTPKQKQVLDFILDFNEEKGYSPSQQEIAKHFKFKSLGTVQNYLVRLQKQGALQRTWNAKRSLEVVSPSTSPHNPKRQSRDEGTVPLPLVGEVAAGLPIEAIETREILEVPSSMLRGSAEHVVLKVSGDSMIEDGILDGDYVILKKQATAHNGQTVVALVNNEATIKRFYKRTKTVELEPANSQYDVIELPLETMRDSDAFRIEGVMVGLVRKLE